MTERDDGGPAFPAPDAGEEHFSQRSAYMGLSVRDLAMLHFTAALLSNPAHAERVHDHANRMQVVTAAVDAFMEARKS